MPHHARRSAPHADEFVSGDRAGSYAEYHEAVDYLPIERLSVERVSAIAENLGSSSRLADAKGTGRLNLPTDRVVVR